MHSMKDRISEAYKAIEAFYSIDVHSEEFSQLTITDDEKLELQRSIEIAQASDELRKIKDLMNRIDNLFH